MTQAWNLLSCHLDTWGGFCADAALPCCRRGLDLKSPRSHAGSRVCQPAGAGAAQRSGCPAGPAGAGAAQRSGCPAGLARAAGDAAAAGDGSGVQSQAAAGAAAAESQAGHCHGLHQRAEHAGDCAGVAAGEGLPGIASNMNVLRVISAEQTLCAPWLVRELQEAEGQALAAIATVRSTLGGWQQVPAQGWTPCLAEADAGAE